MVKKQKQISFAAAIEASLAQAMAEDERIVIFGEDVEMLRLNLFTRFGRDRVFNTPISEGAFVGAAVTAAMGGLRPVVEVMLVDFIAVAMDAVLNHAAKIDAFSGGNWQAPMVIRASCGGGYGDGGQHEQTLWGWLAHIPGISVIVPSNPADAGRLMLTALQADHPVVYLEHKMLSDYWLDYMGGDRRDTVSFDVPQAGARGEAPRHWEPLKLGEARVCREGQDCALISLGVGLHHCLQAAELLAEEGIQCRVIDLRGAAPLHSEIICSAGRDTGRVIVVDEDYERFGLSGEVAAILLEAGIQPGFARVCTRDTIPYDHKREVECLPNVVKIFDAAIELLKR